VGDQPALREREDLDDTGLGRGGHDGLQPFGAHDGACEAYPLDPGDEVPETRRGLELELSGEPLPLPHQRRQVLLAALAAQEGYHLLYHQAAVLPRAHTDARRAATHLAVEADALLTGTSPQGEDPAQSLYAGVEHPGAAVWPEVDDALPAFFRGNPLGERVGLVRVEPYEPAGSLVPTGGVVAGEEALYLPSLEDEGAQLAPGLLNAHLGDLLDQPADLAAPITPVEVRADPRLEVLGLPDIQGGAVLVQEVVDAGRARNAFGEVLLLRFDAPVSPATERRRLPHVTHPGRAQQFQKLQEHPGRRRRVRERPVVRHRQNAEVGDKRRKSVALESRYQAAREL
jgi:hypothetical protein